MQSIIIPYEKYIGKLMVPNINKCFNPHIEVQHMFAAPIPTDDVHNLLLSRWWFASVMDIDLELAAERVIDH